MALITGASSGIGLELARLHAERGGDLVVVARRADRLRELKTELEAAHGVTVYVIATDLTEENAGAAVFEELRTVGIDVEYLVNNAGFGGRGMFHERDWESDRDMIQLNVVALTALCRMFLPGFVARGRGRILNVSSTAGRVPGPLQAVYFATKAYVTSFSNAIAEELRDTGVTVTALLPGATATSFADTADLEDTSLFRRAASARSVAEDGYEAMMAGRLEVISGLPLSQRIGLRLAPLLPTKLALRQVRKLHETQ